MIFFVQHIPERDTKKQELMLRKNLISPDDGLVAKKGEWRSSFSLGERNLIGLNLELYQALKYLNKVAILVFHLKHSFNRCRRTTLISRPTS